MDRPGLVVSCNRSSSLAHTRKTSCTEATHRRRTAAWCCGRPCLPFPMHSLYSEFQSLCSQFQSAVSAEAHTVPRGSHKRSVVWAATSFAPCKPRTGNWLGRCPEAVRNYSPVSPRRKQHGDCGHVPERLKEDSCKGSYPSQARATDPEPMQRFRPAGRRVC